MLSQLPATDLDDARSELLSFLEADAVDHLEFGEGAGTLDGNVAQGRGAEDEKLREAEALGLRCAPCTKAGVQGLLVGCEGRSWCLMGDRFWPAGRRSAGAGDPRVVLDFASLRSE